MLTYRALGISSHDEFGPSESEEAVRSAAKYGETLATLSLTVERTLSENKFAPLPKPRAIAMPVQQLPIWTLPRVVVAVLRGSRRFASQAVFGPAIASESDPYA